MSEYRLFTLAELGGGISWIFKLGSLDLCTRAILAAIGSRFASAPLRERQRKTASEDDYKDRSTEIDPLPRSNPVLAPGQM